jgi:hypothetical protein
MRVRFRLAESTGKIGELNISSELLREILRQDDRDGEE